ncbi:MAG: hypothetical protein ACE5NP_01045 [Anaerolineae bacterium]
MGSRRKLILLASPLVMALLAGCLLYFGPLLASRQSSTAPFCVHTLEVNDRVLSMADQAGFTWVVQLFRWQDIEVARGHYRWGAFDAALRATQYYGLNLVARLDHPPQWATSASNLESTPVDPALYASFVERVASRYRGQIKGYIIWNEPNLAREWGGERPNPAGYVALLKAAYAAIKRADAEALVISAGLAPTNETNDQALDDRLYLEEMYQAGVRGYFDVLGVHPFGFAYPPDDPHRAHQGFNVARLLDLRQVMLAHDDSHKMIWATEFGWTTDAVEEDDWLEVSEEEQSRYLVAGLTKVRRQWPWLEMICIWNLSAGLPSSDEKAGYSIIREDYSPKPAYIALQKLAARSTPGLWFTFPSLAQTQDRVTILAEDVVVHLGDGAELGLPWHSLHRTVVPSPTWRGEFYVPDPGVGPWLLTMEVMQSNQPGNLVLLNDEPLEPAYLPTEDYSTSWVTVPFVVPAARLRPGLNTLTLTIGKRIPPFQTPAALTWDDLQVRNILLEPFRSR